MWSQASIFHYLIPHATDGKIRARSRKMAVMAATRILCSQLVRLVAGGREQWVNLEEIWENGALLECEEVVAPAISARVYAESHAYSGRVAAVEQHEYGWRVEVEFSPITRWNPAEWMPEHAFEPEKQGR